MSNTLGTEITFDLLTTFQQMWIRNDDKHNLVECGKNE